MTRAHDATDLEILRLMSRDANLGAAEIGRHLGMTQPAAWRRIRRLRETGILGGRRLRLDNAALGFGVTVFLGIRLATKGRTSLDEFERAVTAIPEVQLVQHVLGQFDYRLRIVARDIADFERILRRRVMTLPGIGQVEANVVLSEERRNGPLADLSQQD
ncbi:MAG: Lrp/AsnC family transcriptional regulator [Paracoccus sp. (in: a-proteobacteria)]|nr:Lrp/AsnC family transcriptional regulator [Paracoccus sp. (in: a-proteobacteria)]